MSGAVGDVRPPRLLATDLLVVLGDRPVIDGANLELAPGESFAVRGVSGVGKSTFLLSLCGLIRPGAGRVVVDDFDVTSASHRDVAQWRLRNCGIVFQFGELLPELTLSENVQLPLRLLGLPGAEIVDRVSSVLAELGIDHVSNSLPDSVSGGERQRAAIARAVVHDPRLVLADEPTGALDPGSAVQAVQVLLDACRRRSAALVVATHNGEVADAMDRVAHLVDGKLQLQVVAG